MSLNTVNMMGNLTREPEMKTTPSGKAVCRLSVANNHVYMKKDEKVTEVSFFDVEVWGIVAENCFKYLIKGSGVIVEGRLKQDRWEKDGKTQSRIRITASAVHFLPKKKKNVDSVVSDEMLAEEQTVDVVASEDVAWAE